ncbi:protein of unknown function DUF1680 [Ruminiclostridium papyrosolvens DSM 2782]|uniref:Acetyl-CoA carboxylase, biotin carboxylase n=1 Tax=Ruminiclostridium papyrosolvens DSM 2782 TaxID=588581 RepID=F1TG30_9FIRM|nr:beta-L-arabinofuranosidase domain-containing protein [Ruminiclostridium papyrosolvens]EGD46649.1 protein of unknown function DUF1680 [Ruminiclostridium papyrosolvens DSM 2782]WES35799.1 glycoside hydrolase family 127 protein [Ruminiclostridium papyrosolvens DSM 2782]
MSQVKLIDPYLVNAFKKEIEYLEAFDCDKLLSCFYITKGLTPKAENYRGWENTEIRGHTMGHYLTALAQAYSATNDSKIYERLQYLMKELSLCQFESGYLSAFPEEFFDRVENRKPIWVPWYTMHKIITGLISVYKLAKIETALKIVSRLGEWVFSRTDKWTPEIHANVLAVEYGGMNDCMYELYKISGNEKHCTAAHMFDEIELFKEIHDGKDILNNRHANTTIPKFLGALNRYLAIGEEEQFYLDTCKEFWSIVTNNHSYVTGGNSEWEHFGEPGILDAERTSTNCETCNTYNMLKMTRELFKITGNKKYADFYENTFTNAILSSQNPDTGMTMYFQPMETGYFKVYGKPFEHFWCCTGTGMENFTKLNNSIYFYEEDRLYVNMYYSTELNWEEKGVKLTQNSDIPGTDRAGFTIKAETGAEFTLCMRIPTWAKGVKINVNNNLSIFTEERGYALIHRTWKDNDTVEIIFKIEPQLSTLPDNPNAVAFTYGPVVLSAGLGADEMEESTTGVMVTIPSKHVEIKDYLVIMNQSVDEWKKDIALNLKKAEGKLEFRLNGTDEDGRLVFTPHYRQHSQRYGIYWLLVEDGSDELNKYIDEKKKVEDIKSAEIDSIQIGNDQYELSHGIEGQYTESGDRDGFHYRFAKQKGWFSYNLKARNHENSFLQINYMPADCKAGFDILINDTLLSREVIGETPWNKTVSKIYHIPKELIGDRDYVTVKIMASEKEATARVIDILRTMKAV